MKKKMVKKPSKKKTSKKKPMNPAESTMKQMMGGRGE